MNIMLDTPVCCTMQDLTIDKIWYSIDLICIKILNKLKALISSFFVVDVQRSSEYIIQDHPKLNFLKLSVLWKYNWTIIDHKYMNIWKHGRKVLIYYKSYEKIYFIILILLYLLEAIYTLFIKVIENLKTFKYSYDQIEHLVSCQSNFFQISSLKKDNFTWVTLYT